MRNEISRASNPSNRRELSGRSSFEDEEPTLDQLDDPDIDEPELNIKSALNQRNSRVTEELSGGAGAMYLREIANHRLLTAKEEIELAQALERGKEALQELAIADDNLDQLIKEELEKLAEEGEKARRELTECNLRLVVSVARKYLGRGLTFLDLVQEGNIGLQIGVNKYDWRKGFRFSTYVYWWIRQAVTRSIADQARTIRLPVHVTEFLTKIARVEREIAAQTGREPTVDQIAQFLDIDPERINEARRAAMYTLSLETPLDKFGDGDQTRGDLIADLSAENAAQDAAEKSDLSENLESMLREISPRERNILRLRFGLETGSQMTLGEVGERMGISRERVRQMEAEAIRKIRRNPRLRRLIEYTEN